MRTAISIFALIVALGDFVPVAASRTTGGGGQATETRVVHHFVDHARQVTISTQGGFPFVPGSKAVGIARYTAHIQETGERIRGMWIRRSTVTGQLSPTEFAATVTGRNYNRYGTQRESGRLLIEITSGGVLIHGRARLLSGTGRYRHAYGRAGFHGLIPDPNRPFSLSVKGWDSYLRADG